MAQIHPDAPQRAHGGDVVGVADGGRYAVLQLLRREAGVADAPRGLHDAACERRPSSTAVAEASAVRAEAVLPVAEAVLPRAEARSGAVQLLTVAVAVAVAEAVPAVVVAVLAAEAVPVVVAAAVPGVVSVCVRIVVRVLGVLVLGSVVLLGGGLDRERSSVVLLRSVVLLGSVVLRGGGAVEPVGGLTVVGDVVVGSHGDLLSMVGRPSGRCCIPSGCGATACHCACICRVTYMSDGRQEPSADPSPETQQIADALDRIGMRRPPRPGRGGPPFGPGGHPFGHGAPHGFGPRGHGGPHHGDGGPDDHHGDGAGRGGPFGVRGMRGAMGARRMLHAVVRAERPASITDLGHAIGVDQPRASRLIQSLADAGLVRRIPDPRDGRRVVIEATKAGRAHIAAHAEERAAEVAIAAEALTPAERSELARLLTRLADAWPSR